MSTPSQNRRTTRGSVRRQTRGESDVSSVETHALATKQRFRDGLSSQSEPETATESEGEDLTANVHQCVEYSTGTEDDSAAEDANAVLSPQQRVGQDRASVQLAWKLAAEDVGIYYGDPNASAAEVSNDETAPCPETEYESALSMDEDQVTVVDVSTRGAAGASDNVHVVSDQGLEETENTRSDGTLVLQPIKISKSNTSAMNVNRDLPVLARQVAVRHSPERSAARAERPLSAARRDTVDELDAQRLENERDEARRVHTHRKAKSRHTQAGVRPPTPLGARRQQRQAAAGDQVLRKSKSRYEEELVPLRAPAEDDVYVNTMPDRSKRERMLTSREGGLRMPLFDGGDWAGFMSQFEACINYYGWTEKTKTIRLYTSIVGDARKTLGAVGASNWSYAQLKRHMEVRYGKSKVFAQIQAELLQFQRKPGQSLHVYHDELVAASRTANIPEHQRSDLVHTAFVFGLRGNQHMHRWVTRHETEPTLEAALEAAEDYEEEYGNDPVFQSMPISVDARDSTGNAMAVALVGHEHSPRVKTSVNVDAVQTEQADSSLRAEITQGFKQLQTHLGGKLDSLDKRVQSVENWQTNQTKYYKERAQRNRDNNRAKNWNNNKNNNNGDAGKNQSNQKGGQNKQQQGKNQTQEVNTRDARDDSPEEE